MPDCFHTGDMMLSWGHFSQWSPEHMGLSILWSQFSTVEYIPFPPWNTSNRLIAANHSELPVPCGSTCQSSIGQTCWPLDFAGVYFWRVSFIKKMFIWLAAVYWRCVFFGIGMSFNHHGAHDLSRAHAPVDLHQIARLKSSGAPFHPAVSHRWGSTKKWCSLG